MTFQCFVGVERHGSDVERTGDGGARACPLVHLIHMKSSSELSAEMYPASNIFEDSSESS